MTRRHIPELPASVAPEHRALSSGRLATDFERMARGGRVARSRETIENCFPGFLAGWDEAQNTAKSHAHDQIKKPRVSEANTPNKPSKARVRGLSDKALRSRVSAARAAGNGVQS